MMTSATRVSLILAACMAVPAISQADATTFRVRDDGKSTCDVRFRRASRDDDGNELEGDGDPHRRPGGHHQGQRLLQGAGDVIRTDNDLRDEHLQGDGWLDAKKNPNIHFEITESRPGQEECRELKKNKDTKVQVKGKFTAHGITKPVRASGTVKWSDNADSDQGQVHRHPRGPQISVPSIVRLKVANDIAVSVDLRAVAK